MRKVVILLLSDKQGHMTDRIDKNYNLDFTFFPIANREGRIGTVFTLYSNRIIRLLFHQTQHCHHRLAVALQGFR